MNLAPCGSGREIRRAKAEARSRPPVASRASAHPSPSYDERPSESNLIRIGIP